jgi:hypothetical protein
VTNALLPSLAGTTWYLGVPNNTAQTVGFFISATTLTNQQRYTIPAIVLGNLNAGTGGFTFTWTAAPGGQYEVQVSGDLIHWTQAADVTTDGYIGVYTDPAPVGQQCARFYQVIRTQ